MSNEKYYVPHGTYWPIIGSIGVSTLFVGFANQMHDVSWGWPVMVLGFAIIAREERVGRVCQVCYVY